MQQPHGFRFFKSKCVKTSVKVGFNCEIGSVLSTSTGASCVVNAGLLNRFGMLSTNVAMLQVKKQKHEVIHMTFTFCFKIVRKVNLAVSLQRKDRF